mmetsp:Transcript_10279/g.11687  ORF Transcript_10279/g.11687 Transcript_10279/m.11687 type:complete len:568 (-) Transcript_10279:65-1768(-)
MHPNFFKLSSDRSLNDEDKLLNDGLVSIIDNDFFLNFLSNEASLPQDPLSNNINMQIEYPYPTHTVNEMQQLRYQDYQQPDSRSNQRIVPAPIETKLNKVKDNLKIEEASENGKSGKQKGSRRRSKSKKGDDSLGSNSLLDSKPNSKNTYINKINTLIYDEPTKIVEEKPDIQVNEVIKPIKPQESKSPVLKEVKKGLATSTLPLKTKMGVKKVRSFELLKEVDTVEDRLNEKLAKNRESARNSRKRKKIYIELLEKKIDQLQQELNSTKKQLEINTMTLDKATKHSQVMNNIVQGKQQLFSKLEKMITTEADENEVNFLLDSLRLRMGATGSERERAIDFFFKQIYDILLPTHMKYLLMTSSEGKDIFSSKFESKTTIANFLNGNLSLAEASRAESTTDFWSELVENLSLTDSQRKGITKYRKRLTTEKQKFDEIMRNLNITRRALVKQSNSLQSVVDELRSTLNPIQVGKMLIFLDKEKSRKEFEVENLWKVCKPSKSTDDGGDEENEEDNDSVDSDKIGGGSSKNKREFIEPPVRVKSNLSVNNLFLKTNASDVIRKKIHSENS